MTETQEPTASAEPPRDQSGAAHGGPGMDRDHLRNYEQLTRSTVDRKIAGVAGGLGRHLRIDPTVLRVLFVVLCFFGGAGFVLYGAAWLLVPEDGRRDGHVPMSPQTRNALLIGAGVVAALLLLAHGWGGFGFPWPAFVVGVGVLVYLVVRGSGSGGARPLAPYPPAAYGPVPTYGPVPPGATSTSVRDTGVAPPSAGPDVAPPAPPWLPPAAVAYQPPPRPKKRGPLLFGFTLALVALALGGLGVYDAAGGHVAAPAYAALALAVVGVMLVVGSFLGRAGGLVLLAVLGVAALGVTSAVDYVGTSAFHEGKELNATPRSAVDVQDSYYLITGRVFLDLSTVRDPAALSGRTIDVGARVGEVVVVLPDGIQSDVTSDVSGPGQIDLPDHQAGGIDTHAQSTFHRGADGGTVTIVAHVKVGHLEIRNP
jgi:phage shock protein PspC (stress-responsive transcriptional regulator)